MKIVCDSCGAKYSIADEKVRGKVFKIRCKKCSDVIVVKGDGDEQGSAVESSDPEGSFDENYGAAGGASEWYAVIDGDQAGPITPDEVEAYFKEDVLDEDSYAWREGLDDWQKLGELDEFSHLFSETANPNDKTRVAGSSPQFDQHEPSDDGRTVVTDSNEFGAHDPGQLEGTQEEQAPGSGASALGGLEASGGEAQDVGGQGGEFETGGSGAALGSGGHQAMGEESFDEAGEEPQSAQNALESAFETGQSSPGAEGDVAGDGAGLQSGGSSAGIESGSGSASVSESGGQQQSSLGTGGPGDEPGNTGFDANDALGGAASGGGGQMAAAGDSGGGSSFESFSGGESGQSAVSGGADSGGGNNARSGGGPQLSSSDDMVGQRSENSVLFSLSSVDEMKAVDGPEQQEQVEGAGATTEGSGLIDIQSLAATHAAMSEEEEQQGGAGGQKAAAAGGQQATGANAAVGGEQFQSDSMQMPSLAPSGSRGNNTALIIAIVVGFVFLSAAIVAAVIIMTRDSEPKKIVKKTTKSGAATKKAGSAGAAGGTQNPETSDKAGAAAGKADESEQEGKEDEGKKESAEKGDEGSGEEGSEEGSSESKEEGEDEVAESSSDDDDHGGGREPDPDPEPRDRHAEAPDPEPSSGGGGGGDDMDNLLNQVGKKEESGGGGSGGGGGARAQKDLPPKPTRSMVKNTIAKYTGRIRGCAQNNNSQGLSGSVFIKFRIEPSGRVGSASVRSSKFKGTDVGNCVRRIVEQMKFPETQNGMPVKFPFSVP